MVIIGRLGRVALAFGRPYRLSFDNMHPASQRARGWCFTLNNYTTDHELSIQALQYKYLVYGREVAETGTPHLQGYIYFVSQRKLSAVRRLIPGAHLSVRGGTHQQASDYCKKDGNYFEDGEAPLDQGQISARGSEANKSKWKDIKNHAASGDMQYIAEHYPKEYVIYKPRLESIYAPDTQPIEGELLHEWWIGSTGTGKSRLLWELYPNHYPKSINKWWDGYRFEPVVAIEEWSPDNTLTAQSLKKWADRYPFPGEIKGGVIQKVRPLKIIVLSNYTLEQCFPRIADLSPIARRFKVINFPDGIQHARFRAAWINNPPPVSQDDEESVTTADTESELLFDLDFLNGDL